MLRRPPRSARADARFPVTALFRSGGACEIGVEGPATEECGVRERQPDIFALGHLAGPDPAAADVDGARADLVVGLVAHLAAIGADLDVGVHRQRLKLARETVVLALDITDCRHISSDRKSTRLNSSH